MAGILEPMDGAYTVCPKCLGRQVEVRWNAGSTVSPQSALFHGYISSSPLQTETFCIDCGRRSLLSVQPREGGRGQPMRIPTAPLPAPSKRRKSIGAAQRLRIFTRDNFQCQYCGASPPDVVLEVDHVVPVSTGGSNSDDNLATSCRECNSGKGALEV